MIVFYAQGGLGNQLFQYATARRLSLRHNCELVLDPYWFAHPGKNETPRSLELNQYSISMRLATNHEQRMWRFQRGRLSRYVNSLLTMNLLREQGTNINQDVLNASANSYLIGYWQSEAYFHDIRSILLSELVPLDSPSAADLAIMDLMKSNNAVSLHVRRGDYVALKSASVFHGTCSLKYYRSAIQFVADRVDSPMFFIFSDDPEWTRANLELPFLTHYVDHNVAGHACQDLRLMSHCQHHIIANSSFSWWGAWLVDSPNGVVVAPSAWFANGQPTPNLIPERWHCL